MGTLDSASLTYPTMKAAFTLALLFIGLIVLETSAEYDCDDPYKKGPKECSEFRAADTEIECVYTCSHGGFEIKREYSDVDNMIWDEDRNRVEWNPKFKPSKRCRCVYGF